MICDGSEHSIFECQHDGWGVTGSCQHKDDAGVRCIRAGVFLEIVTKLPKSTSCVTAGKVVDSQFFIKEANSFLVKEGSQTTSLTHLKLSTPAVTRLADFDEISSLAKLN